MLKLDDEHVLMMLKEAQQEKGLTIEVNRNSLISLCEDDLLLRREWSGGLKKRKP